MSDDDLYPGAGGVRFDVFDDEERAIWVAHDSRYEEALKQPRGVRARLLALADEMFFSALRKKSSNVYFDPSVPASKLRQRLKQARNALAYPICTLWRWYRD